MKIRPPAVAGSFYPADATELRDLLDRCFADSVAPHPDEVAPQALVVPHAGLVYSGPIAASAYRRLETVRHAIRRVVLLGPSHRVPLRGLGCSSADAWQTPLGIVPVAEPGALAQLDRVQIDDRAHAPEHSLEVQLPFLQTVLDDFELLPLVVGETTPQQVAAVIEAVWSGPETLLVVSTDLSHYHAYDEARRRDTRTADAITALQPDQIDLHDACGAWPLRGLLQAGRERHLTVRPLDLRNSGDTAGDRTQVVGYGAFALA